MYNLLKKTQSKMLWIFAAKQHPQNGAVLEKRNNKADLVFLVYCYLTVGAQGQKLENG